MGKQLFSKFEGIDIPLVSTGSSPFIGSPQFGKNSLIYRKKFLNDPDAMNEILEASYEVGGRGFEIIPFGKICEAAKIMKQTHDDFIITGSTLPNFLGPDPLIEDLINAEAKIIFIFASISDSKGEKLIELLDDISSRGVIPGIATHNPVQTLEYIYANNLNVKAVLVPFNVNGIMMGNQSKLEKIVDNHKNTAFIGMKTLAAGNLEPKKAFEYISKHNVCAVAIGMVQREETRDVTEIALQFLQK